MNETDKVAAALCRHQVKRDWAELTEPEKETWRRLATIAIEAYEAAKRPPKTSEFIESFDDR